MTTAVGRGWQLLPADPSDVSIRKPLVVTNRVPVAMLSTQPLVPRMGMSMWFAVLGTLTVEHGSSSMLWASRRERVVPSLLLLSANRTVSVEAMVGYLWPDEPPPTARKQVQNCVAAVSRRLYEIDGQQWIVFDGRGYKIVQSAATLDALAFEEAVRAGQDAHRHGRIDDALRSYQHALSLWRGEVLMGVEDVRANAAALRLAELRWSVYELCIQMELPQAAVRPGEWRNSWRWSRPIRTARRPSHR